MSFGRLLAFLGIVVGVLGAIHAFIWLRLVREPAWPGLWMRIGTSALIALLLVVPVAMLMPMFAPRTASAPFAWIAYTWLGVMFFLFVLLVPIELGRWVTALFGVVTREAPVDPERRRFFARAISATVLSAGAGLAAFSVYSGLRRVATKRVRVALAKLPEELSGFRIVQLSDIHVGPTIGRAFIEELVARTNALEPHIVAITGDLVDGSVEDLGKLVEPLRNIRAAHGVFFVTGNHEYYSGADAWIAFLGTLGVRTLRNERVTIAAGADSIDVAGVDDWTASQFGNGHGPDLPRALQGRDANRPIVLLAHQPKAVVEAAAHGVDLQLSGHTHGGQLFPFNYLVKLEQPYVSGLHLHERTHIYVSNGTGYWGPPMRLGAPAEITLLELEPNVAFA